MRYGHYPCGPARGRAGWHKQPPVDIKEEESAYTIFLYAPDLVKENISLFTKNDVLFIRYKDDTPDDSAFTRREYRRNEIERDFDLRNKIDSDRIEASYANGVLKVVLPKSDAARRPMQAVIVQ